MSISQEINKTTDQKKKLHLKKIMELLKEKARVQIIPNKNFFLKKENFIPEPKTKHKI